MFVKTQIQTTITDTIHTHDGITDDGGNGLITTSVKADPEKFNTNVLAQWSKLSFAKRAMLMVKKWQVAGVAMLRSSTTLATIYKPREAAQDGQEETCILGTSSNDLAQLRAKTMEKQQCLSNVVCIVSKQKVPTNGVFAAGQDIDKSEPKLRDVFYENNNLRDNDAKVAVRLPTTIPLPYHSSVKVGRIDTGTFTTLEDVDSTGIMIFWLETLQSHSQEAQALLLTEDELKKYLPRAPPTGHGYVDSPFIVYKEADEFDESLKLEIEDLARELKEISNRNTRGPISVVDFHQKKDAESIPPEVASSKPKHADADYFDAGLKALGACIDKDNNVILPELSKFVPAFRDTTTKTRARENFLSTLNNIQDSMNDSDLFYSRNIDLPEFENLQLAYLSQGNWSADRVESLDVSTSNGAMPTMLLPDTQSTAQKKVEQSDLTVAETALGEHESNRTKMSTKFTAAPELRSLFALLAYLANNLCVYFAYWTFDYTREETVPFLVSVAIGLSKILTSRRAKMFFKSASQEDKQKFLYYVLNQHLASHSALARASKDVSILTSILENDVEGVSKTNYTLARTIIQDTYSKIEQIFLGSAEVPSTSLYISSAANQRFEQKKLKEQQALLNDLVTKQPTTPRGTGGKRKGSDLSSAERASKLLKPGDENGWLKTTVDNFQLPKELYNGDFKMCKSNAKKDCQCPYGDRCKFSHKPFEKFDRELQKTTVKWVDTTDHLSFDSSVDTKLLEEIRASM
jgi:hypothetical protein